MPHNEIVEMVTRTCCQDQDLKSFHTCPNHSSNFTVCTHCHTIRHHHRHTDASGSIDWTSKIVFDPEDKEQNEVDN